jgi:type III pantothenate kinase
MALLAIDVGNTNTVLGIYEGARLARHWRVETKPARTVDEHAVLMRDLLRGVTLDGAALSCVVPALTPTFRALCGQYLQLELLVVEPGVRTGLAMRYETPHTLGSDRLVNAVAAYDARAAPPSWSTSAPRRRSSTSRRTAPTPAA